TRLALGPASEREWRTKDLRRAATTFPSPRPPAAPVAPRERTPMQETILQSVGRTPLVRLRRLTEGLSATVYVKVEALNPGGSVKDRVAVAMIAEAERR